jgi:hypothetical protein
MRTKPLIQLAALSLLLAALTNLAACNGASVLGPEPSGYAPYDEGTNGDGPGTNPDPNGSCRSGSGIQHPRCRW